MSEQCNSTASSQSREVLQLCHGYGMPFHDVARQYATLFKGTNFKVTTVFLTGKIDDKVAQIVESDEVIFLENTSQDIRGLKRKQIKQVRDICKERNFKFCIAHRFKPIYIAAHVPGLKVIGVHHAFGDYQRWARKFFVQRRKARVSLLGVSNAVRNDIRQSLSSFPKEQIHTLYNRINIEEQKANLITRKEARSKLELPDNAYVFANVGRLHPDKDQRTLLNAFARIHKQIPEAVLVIMGKGKLEGALRDQVKNLEINDKVIFTGAISNGSYYFKAFDSFVLSSDHEPFGMVLLEAMIAGLPLAVCNSGGAPEVCGETGLTFELQDSIGLANSMIQLANMSPAEISNNKNKMVERLTTLFTDEAVRNQFWNTPFVRDLA